MSAGGKVFGEDVDKVKYIVEQCIWRYMKKNEVMDILYQQQNIEPIFTKIVWESLEEENPQFFEAYHLGLMVNDQISQFNNLLDTQATLLHQLAPHGVVSAYGSHHIPPAMHHNAASCYNAPENNGIGINNGGPYIRSEMQHGPLNMVFAHNLNGLLGNSNYQANGGVLESHDPAFGIMDSIPDQFMDDTTRSSQLLRQFSHDMISPPDSTPDFTNTNTDTVGFPMSTLGPNYFSNFSEDS